MYNLYLVQPVDSYGPNTFLPLAASYQWVYAKTDPDVKDNFVVSDVILRKDDIAKYVDAMEKPDVVALSCYVWNWKYNLELSKAIKIKFPKSKIIIGGPSVDKRDHSFFKTYPWIDVAVTGEGELAFKSLLKSFIQGEDLSKFYHPSLCNVYSSQGITKELELPKRIEDINVIPSPILDGFYDEIFEMYKTRTDKDTKWQVTYETLRGCPYHCAFCDIGDSYWNKIKRFEIERVKKEIDWMSEKKIEYVSVCDSNWGILDRDKEITAYVIKKKKETGYPKFWDVTWAKSNSQKIYEIAKMEKTSGTNLFKGVTFAMQSFNQDTLSATDRFNIDEKTANEYLSRYKKHDIPTYSELIWPMPNETYSSLKQGIQKLVDLGQKDFLMVHPLVLTPNAPMGQPNYRKKWNIKTKNVPLDTFYLKVEDMDSYVVEYTEAVYETNTVSFEENLKGFMFSYLFIVMFYYGWGYLILEYLNARYGKKHTEVVEDMLQFFSEHTGIINSELHETKKAYKEVFFDQGFWGRKGLCPDDIYWEYKSATSVVLDRNRDKLKTELSNFLKHQYGIENKCLIDANEILCYDFRKKYPIIFYTDDNDIKNILGVTKDRLIFSHHEKDKLCEPDFHKIAFHYQRKNRYWKCEVGE